MSDEKYTEQEAVNLAEQGYEMHPVHDGCGNIYYIKGFLNEDPQPFNSAYFGN